MDSRSAAQRELARRELARREYYEYARCVYPGWIDTRHHRLLARYLEEVERYVATGGREGIGRLLVFMPPRHGKSLNVSTLFPTWFLGRNPNARVIIASYNGSLATGFSRAARNILVDTPYRVVFGDRSGRESGREHPVGIASDSRSVEAWNLAPPHKGGMTAAGVGGGITGKGAHLFVVDDPHKDRADVESDTRRAAVWDWWTSTAYTRLEDGAAVIGMLTRWHADDWAGRLLKAMVDDDGADRWTVLCLPAVAEEWAEAVEPDNVIAALKDGWWRGVDPLGRAPGEPLWPEKYGLDDLETIRANVGGRDWDALYQQRPRQMTGNLIRANDIIVVAEAPEGLREVRYWDLAVSGRDRADYIVGAKVGRAKDGKLYILDIARFPGPWADARPRMVRVMLADGPAVAQGIEVSGQQGGYFQELQRDKYLGGVPIQSVNPREVGNKEVRANVWASRIEDGLVAMARAPWNDLFIAEALAFPRGAHDDQIDGVSGAVQMLPSFVRFSEVPQSPDVPSKWDAFGEIGGMGFGAVHSFGAGG